MAFHHGTIRKYTAALLDFFNNLEVQYENSAAATVVRNIPCVYTSREKSRILDDYTRDQFISGNLNVLPRATIALSTMVRSEARTMNKKTKINTKSNPDTFEYSFNSVPYEFTYELSIMCRGMNEATQVIEQVAPKFNPVVNIDIWDAVNLNEPTRVPVRLLDIGIEQEEYEELSTNLVTVSIGLSIGGNLYQPIQTSDRVQQFKMFINEFDETGHSKKIIDNWDVDSGGNLITPGTSTQVQSTTQYPPSIIDIVPTNPLIVGSNALTVIWDDKDNKITEMTFDWALNIGTGVILGNLDTATLDLSLGGPVEVQVTITDPFGNFATLTKQLIATPYLPEIAITSAVGGDTINLGADAISGTYNATDSTVQSITGLWVTDNVPVTITDNGNGTWSTDGGVPLVEDVAQDFTVTITTADGDTASTTMSLVPSAVVIVAPTLAITSHTPEPVDGSTGLGQVLLDGNTNSSVPGMGVWGTYTDPSLEIDFIRAEWVFGGPGVQFTVRWGPGYGLSEGVWECDMFEPDLYPAQRGDASDTLRVTIYTNTGPDVVVEMADLWPVGWY